MVGFGDDKLGAKEVKNVAWIQKLDIKNENLSNILNKRLGIGESDEIVLTLELNTVLGLLYDKKVKSLQETQDWVHLKQLGFCLKQKEER